jgi:hypothetical protein
MTPPIMGAVKITERPLIPNTIPAWAEEPVVSNTNQGTAICTAELPALPKIAEICNKRLFFGRMRPQ